MRRTTGSWRPCWAPAPQRSCLEMALWGTNPATMMAGGWVGGWLCGWAACHPAVLTKALSLLWRLCHWFNVVFVLLRFVPTCFCYVRDVASPTACRMTSPCPCGWRHCMRTLPISWSVCMQGAGIQAESQAGACTAGTAGEAEGAASGGCQAGDCPCPHQSNETTP